MVQPLTDEQVYDFFYERIEKHMKLILHKLSIFIREQVKECTQLRPPYEAKQLKRNKIILCSNRIDHDGELKGNYWLERNGQKIGITFLEWIYEYERRVK